MATVQIEAQVSDQDLLQAVAQLDTAALQQFVTEVLRIRARRLAPQLPADEGDLLVQISRGLPEDLRQRYQELIVERQQEALTPDERAELLRLTDRVEKHEGDRLSALTELARLRGMTLSDLVAALGIRPPTHE